MERGSAGQRSLEQSSFGQRMTFDGMPLSRTVSSCSSLAGWEIDPDDIGIMTRADGSDWTLGRGSHGQVCSHTYGFLQ